MYYKITNQDSKVYQELKALREKEVQIDADNEKKIQEEVGQKFSNYLGYEPQSGFQRTRTYIGFEFERPEDLDPKVWKQHPDHHTISIPNRRYKVGRQMASFINELDSSFYLAVYDIMGLEHLRRFTTPYVEIVDDIIICFLDQNHKPEDTENVIEITSKEFEEIRERLLSIV